MLKVGPLLDTNLKVALCLNEAISCALQASGAVSMGSEGQTAARHITRYLPFLNCTTN